MHIYNMCSQNNADQPHTDELVVSQINDAQLQVLQTKKTESRYLYNSYVCAPIAVDI